MKTITISEIEYLGLLETINRLSSELMKIKTKPQKKTKSLSHISDRLHGSVKIPSNFDYKMALEDAILEKHLK